MTTRLFLLLAIALALAACASPSGNKESLQDFVERQVAAAAKAEQTGNLREALNLWGTVLTVEPDNAVALAAVETLQGAIGEDTQRAIARGDAAYAKGNTRDGDRWMLRALALTPGEPSAFNALRRSVSDASHRRQKEKVESSYPGVTAKTVEPSAPVDARSDIQRFYEDSDYEAVVAAAAAQLDSEQGLSVEETAWVRDAHLSLAQRAENAQKPEQQLMHLDAVIALSPDAAQKFAKQRQGIAETLSSDYYRQSLSLIKSDLDAAIAKLEDAVSFNPANIAATEKLDQAKTLKRNLSKIKAR